MPEVKAPFEDEESSSVEGDATAHRPPRRVLGLSAGAWAVLVVAVALIAGVCWFAPELGGIMALKPWSDGPWTAALNELITAVEAGDTGRLDTLAHAGSFQCEFEGGRIVSLKLTGDPMAPPFPPESVLPRDVPGDATVEYQYDKAKANVSFTAVDGRSTLLVFEVRGGKWGLTALRPQLSAGPPSVPKEQAPAPAKGDGE